MDRTLHNTKKAKNQIMMDRQRSILVVLIIADFLLRLVCSLSNNNRSNSSKRNHHRLKNEGRHRRMESLMEKADHRTRNESRELQSLKQLGDPYDASLFGSDHIAFKQSHNQAFCDLVQHFLAADGPLIYLDGADGATTRLLLESGIAKENLHVANEWSDTVDRLKGFDICVHCGKLQSMDCSQIACVGAYLDGCGGDTEPIINMVDTILTGKIAPKMVLGFTLTNAEPTGRSLVDRVQDVTRHVHWTTGLIGYHIFHVGDDPIRFGVDPNLLRQHETTTTCWLALMQGGE